MATISFTIETSKQDYLKRLKEKSYFRRIDIIFLSKHKKRRCPMKRVAQNVEA